MTPGTFVRLFICLFVLGGSLYLTIQRQNEITRLHIALPKMVKEIHEIQEEITRLQFEIDSFENPLHLMQLAHLSEYSHLKHPIARHIVKLTEGNPLNLPPDRSIQEINTPSTLSLASILFDHGRHSD